MMESRLESKLSASERSRGRHRHLVRRGQSWRFQMRVPADLDPCRKMATLRINLGPLPIRFAERRSRELAAAAEIAFAQLRRVRDMSDQSGGAPGALGESIFAIESRVSNELGWTLLQDLREVIDQIEKSKGYDPSQAPEEQVRRHDLIKNIYNVEAELRQPNPEPYVVAHADELRQGAFWLWANKIQRGADGYAAAIEGLGEESPPSGEPEPNALLSALATQASALEKQASALQMQSAAISELTRQPANSGPTLGGAAAPVEGPKAETIPPAAAQKFSEATEGYLTTRISANGGIETADIKSTRMRAALFMEIVGDKTFDAYRRGDLQTFVDELQYWPPRPETCEALRGGTLRQILDANKEAKHAYGVLGLNTVTGHYLNDVQCILNHAAREAGRPDPFPEPRLIMPKIFKAPEKRKAPRMATMNDTFRLAIESGSFELVALPWLGMTSGRRIALLAYARGCDFRRVGDHVVVYVPEHSVDPKTGAIARAPIKTEDSRAGFVMHQTLIDSGFCSFAMRLGDQFLFRSRHESCRDPADAAQKAINRLLKKADAGGTFHGFRHWHITQMREAGVSDYAQRVQSGHTRRDEHMDYGELPFSARDAALIRDLPMPDEIDFRPLMRLNFADLRR